MADLTFFDQLQRNRAQMDYWLQRRMLITLRDFTGGPWLLPAGFRMDTPNYLTGRIETTWEIYQSLQRKYYLPGF